jgi:hypothetical protein
MIIKCNHNNYSQLELSYDLKKYLNEIHPGGIDKVLPLLIDKFYICYAIVFGPFIEWLFVMDETGTRYPTSFPRILFLLVDKFVSRYWTVGEHVDFKNNRSPILAFEEWAENEHFHGYLFEGDKDALTTFESYKKLMDVEFPRPDITEMAEPIDNPYWVFDSKSEESWQSNPFDALIRVPNTNKFINNPYYKRLKKNNHSKSSPTKEYKSL